MFIDQWMIYTCFPISLFLPRLVIALIIRDTPRIIISAPSHAAQISPNLLAWKRKCPVHETKEPLLCPSPSKRQGCALVRNRDIIQPYLKHQHVAHKDIPLAKGTRQHQHVGKKSWTLNSMYQTFFSSHTFQSKPRKRAEEIASFFPIEFSLWPFLFKKTKTSK